MSITGAADGPPFRLGVAIARHRLRHVRGAGRRCWRCSRANAPAAGQLVDVAMLDSVAALLTYQAGNLLRQRHGAGAARQSPPEIVPYETFAASDGEFVLAVGNDDQWRRFCAVAGLTDDERFATNRQRVTAYDELRPIVADRLRTEHAAVLDRPADRRRRAVRIGARICEELFADPQLAAREMIAQRRACRRSAPLQLLGVPVKLSDTPGVGPHGAADARPAHGSGLARRIWA